ncbi:MAG: hypothetical protein AAGE80_09600 [Pseudomonadota bacterium]
MSDLEERRQRERELKQKRDRSRESGKRRRRSNRFKPKPLMFSARFLGGIMVLAATFLSLQTAITHAPRERMFASDGLRVLGTVEERFLEERSIDLVLLEIERRPRRMLTVAYQSLAGPRRFTSEVSEEVYERESVGDRIRVEYVLSQTGMERLPRAQASTPVGFFLIYAAIGATGLVLFLFGPVFWRGRYF